MKKTKRYEFFDWMIVNVLAPLMLPFIIALSARLLIYIDKNCTELFIFLLRKGVYNFLGMFILISLYQDYRIAKKVFGVFLWLIVIILVYLQGLIFLNSLGLIKAANALTFDENMGVFILVTVSSLVASIIGKLVILREKYKNIIIIKL